MTKVVGADEFEVEEVAQHAAEPRNYVRTQVRRAMVEAPKESSEQLPAGRGLKPKPREDVRAERHVGGAHTTREPVRVFSSRVSLLVLPSHAMASL
jgi:hypothetical protein